MGTHLEGHRGTSQFMDIREEGPDGEMVDDITRRPSSHTDRADTLGLETRRHPLRGRRRDDNHDYQGSEEVLIEGEVVHISLPQPRPELSPKVHVEHSAAGQVASSECQPSFRRTRQNPFVVSDLSPAPAAIQASSNRAR